jgi:hypothetical protein
LWNTYEFELRSGKHAFFTPSLILHCLDARTQEAEMKMLIFAVLLLAQVSHAQAKGCLKGAVVGGLAAQVGGHHGGMGALAGCAVGHGAKRRAQIQKKDR